jgi:hypothetical protein
VQYALLIYTDPTTDGPPEGEMSADYATFTQEIVDSKEIRGGERLRGVDAATSVRVRSGRTDTVDGPFAETKEQLGGFYLVDVPDLDRALELAAKIPAARTGVVEVRPIDPMGG